jgi:hypothetical protein
MSGETNSIGVNSLEKIDSGDGGRSYASKIYKNKRMNTKNCNKDASSRISMPLNSSGTA